MASGLPRGSEEVVPRDQQPGPLLLILKFKNVSPMMLKKGSGNKSGISVEGIYQSFILLKTRLINHSIGVKNNNFEEKKDVCLKDKER